jgi:peptidoglycan hydrolase-like protein with peptidoglycan-binding domain
MFTVTSGSATAFIDEARAQLGYLARPGRDSIYGTGVGYRGLPWDGSFVDVVARQAGVSDRVPACTYSPSGLSWFIRRNRVVVRPQPGDIVFFTFSTGAGFEAPHVGIVSDVSAWPVHRAFKSIEGMVSPGTPKGIPTNDGVHERIRYANEVLAFGRPAWGTRFTRRVTGDSASDQVKFSHVQPGNRKPLRAVRLVQDALAIVVGLRGFKDGVFDTVTRAGYASWQRELGYVGSDAAGAPDPESLTRLGSRTGLFSVVP